MSLLSLHDIGQSFGDFDLFAGIDASLPHDAKVGLVGPNGIGKTTLLKIIAGEAKASSGAVHFARGTRFGYLQQHAAHAFTNLDNALWDELLLVFEEIRSLERKLAEMEHALGDADADFLERYGDLQHRFDALGGYDYEVRLKQTLTGLGFKEQHYGMPLHQLSGGQKTRALLAKLLLERPDLLILDEPTNHLDVGAIQWLENALHNWPGAMLIVSHDRYFLDRVVNTIWEMSRAGVEVYRGNYTTYLKERQNRWDYQLEVFETEKERMLKELDFIKRNIARASSNARAVGRLRILSREIVAVQEVGVIALKNTSWLQLGIDRVKPLGVMEAEDAIKSLTPPHVRPPRLNMRLKAPARSGNNVLRTTGLEIGYPGNPLFKTGDILLLRGETAALIGPNGTGKTTLLKTLLQQLPPLKGEVELGANLKIGYFSQTHDGLNLKNTLIDELTRHHPMGLGEARNILGRYLFREDDVFKPVEMLSGGERGRLALAILSLQGANFLLLDEPTNHLDIPTQEILQEVMENFDGTTLLVSHDRYLIDRLATQIWEIKGGRLHLFSGTYQEYLAAGGSELPDESPSPNGRSAAIPSEVASAPERPVLSKNERRRREQQAAELEKRIHALEAELARVTSDLEAASAAQKFADIQRLSTLYEEKQTELETVMEAWAAIEL